MVQTAPRKVVFGIIVACGLLSLIFAQQVSHKLNSTHLVARTPRCENRFKWSTVSQLDEMYSKYSREILGVMKYLDEFCKNISCLSTNVEMEIMYMRVRERKPRIVFEMCTNAGNSAVWLLHALNQNNNGAELVSFDMFAPKKKQQLVDLAGSTTKWTFEEGDMTETIRTVFTRPGTKEALDYIFFDGSHDVKQAYWMRQAVLEPMVAQLHQERTGRTISISVHDVYNSWYARGHPYDLSQEGASVFEWMGMHADVSVCNVFEWTTKNNETRWIEYAAVRERRLGFKTICGKEIAEMRTWCTSLTLWFELY